MFSCGVAGCTNFLFRGIFTDVLVPNAAVVGQNNHIALVFNPLTADIRAYLNGVMVNAVAQSASLSFSGTGPFKGKLLFPKKME